MRTMRDFWRMTMIISNPYQRNLRMTQKNSYSSKLQVSKARIIDERIIDNMIEKNLGEGEKMIVQRSSIIGFSQSVEINNCSKNGFTKKEFIIVEGPGMIIIETGPD